MSNNTTEKKAVVFDLDGTLLYTLEDLKNATNYALKQNGMPERTLDEVRRFVGNGVKLLMERAVPDGADNPKFEKTFSDFKEYYEAHCNDNTAPYDGIMELLKELKLNGIKLAIVSNKLDPAVKELNQALFQGVYDIGQSARWRRKASAKSRRLIWCRRHLKELRSEHRMRQSMWGTPMWISPQRKTQV